MCRAWEAPLRSELAAVALRASGNALSNLGQRLMQDRVAESDLNDYDAFIVWANHVAELLEEELQGMDWETVLGRPIMATVTSRAKSKDTLVQKLRMRYGIQLPRIRDVIGARIVANVTLFRAGCDGRSPCRVF